MQDIDIIGITGRKGGGKDSLAEHLIALHGGYKIALADSLKRLCRSVFEVSTHAMFGPSKARGELVRTDRYADFNVWMRACATRLDILSFRIEGVSSAQSLQRFYAVCRDHFEGPYQRGELDGRLILQYMGTEWGRSLNQNIWRDRMWSAVYRVRNGEAYSQSDGILIGERHDLQSGAVIAVPDVRFQNEAEIIRAHKNGLVYYVDAERRLGPRTDNHASEPSPEEMRDMSSMRLDNNGAMDWPAAIRQAEVLR